MTTSRFEGAKVLGFSEGGVTKGTPDVWSSAVPLSPPWTPPKAPGKPRGKSVNEGHKYDFLD